MVAALAAAYFLLWPAVRPSDDVEALSFVVVGISTRAAIFAVGVWLLSGLCALATLAARPQSALLAALIGIGGLSLRSGQMRTLVWSMRGDIPQLYTGLILEMLFLAAVLAVAVWIVGAVRHVVAAVRPRWVRQSDHEKCSDHQVHAACEGSFLRLLAAAAFGAGDKVGRRGRAAARTMLLKCVYCTGVAMLVSAVGLLILMQSDQRGQILFALVASCAIGAFVAMQIFPTHCSFPVLAATVLLAIATYALTAATGGNGDRAWMDVQNYARALPTDWMTAGAGGAVLGFWIHQRMHEVRKFERTEQQ